MYNIEFICNYNIIILYYYIESLKNMCQYSSLFRGEIE